MSSRKDTKVLIEGWRRYLTEAENKVIRIIDFDGTIFKPPADFAMIKNPFFMGALNDEGFEKVYLHVIEGMLEKNAINPEYANLNKKTDYVVSAVKSFGGGKPVDYWHTLLQKNDEKLVHFMKHYLKVEPTVENLKYFGQPSLDKTKAEKHNFIKQVTGLPDDRIMVVSNKENDSKSSAVKKIVADNGTDAEYICVDNDKSDLDKMQSAVRVAKEAPKKE